MPFRSTNERIDSQTSLYVLRARRAKAELGYKSRGCGVRAASAVLVPNAEV